MYSINGLFEFHLHIQNLQSYEIFTSWLNLFYSRFICASSNFGYLSVIPFIIKGINITPVKSYLNADIDKRFVYAENKNKSGIYILTNLTNNKCYVGSSVDLRKRFTWYYSLESIEEVASISVISRALLRYGYSGFRLDILEYCNPEQLIKREQYYLNTIKPEYNILRVAGSSLGYKHSEEALAKIIARSLSPEHKEHLKKLHLSRSHKVEIFDTLSNKTTVYSSAREAARSIRMR